MHETVIASSLLKIITEETAKQNKNLYVDEIRLKIGLLNCIEAQTVQGCFEILAENTRAEHAKMIIERLPLEGFCNDCQKNISITKRHFVCPLCQSGNVDWQGGNEMQITSIKVHEKKEEEKE